MNAFARQRWVGITALLVLSVAALWAHLHWRESIRAWAFITGWALFGVMVFLTVYNARKKVPFLPLVFSSEAWLQLHIYLGFFTVALFLMHLDFRWPTGWFEVVLALLYALVTGSGVVGLFITRDFPRRLTTRGGEVIYERIPVIRRRLRQEAESLAFAAAAEANSVTLPDFFARRLLDYFSAPRNFLGHLFDSRRPLGLVLGELDDLRRYLNDKERAALAKLADLVRQKDGLDYHYSLQTALKLWLFVHIPLTYSLMVFAVAHIVIVFAFSSGAGGAR
jgi:uncharacterized membrane protein